MCLSVPNAQCPIGMPPLRLVRGESQISNMAEVAQKTWRIDRVVASTSAMLFSICNAASGEKPSPAIELPAAPGSNAPTMSLRAARWGVGLARQVPAPGVAPVG